MFCSKCGAELMEGDMFCAKCGTRFDTEFFNEQSTKTETNIEEKQHYEYHTSADKNKKRTKTDIKSIVIVTSNIVFIVVFSLIQRIVYLAGFPMIFILAGILELIALLLKNKILYIIAAVISTVNLIYRLQILYGSQMWGVYLLDLLASVIVCLLSILALVFSLSCTRRNEDE